MHCLMVDLYEVAPGISHPLAAVVQNEGARVCFEFNKRNMRAAALIADLSEQGKIRDLPLKDPDIEDIVKTIYHSGGES